MIDRSARVCCSDFVRSRLLARCSANTTVITLGVDIGVFMPSRNRPQGNRIVVNADLRDSRKGLDYLLEAVAAPPEVEMRIIGAARERPVSNVTFTGPLWRHEVVAEVHAIVGARPPVRVRCRELRNGACRGDGRGVPVIASNPGGIPTLVTDGVAGLLVAPRDPPALVCAIRRLTSDPAYARWMGARGRVLAVDRHGRPGQIDTTERLLGAVITEAVRRCAPAVKLAIAAHEAP